MGNAVRALTALIAVGAALILVAPAAHADVLDEIVIAHRAGAASRLGEATMESYKDSVANHADILDGDIHWTKDSPNDSDTLGSIIIIHDDTLDRMCFPLDRGGLLLGRGRLVGGQVLVGDGAQHLGAAVPSAGVVEVVAPGQHDAAGVVGVGQLVMGQDLPFQAGEK